MSPFSQTVHSDTKIKLFCLPYAGGSATIYKKWENYVNRNIEVHPVELSGRGKRTREPLYSHVQNAVDDVYGIIAASISDGKPYAIYGHSMGAQLAYEVTQRIMQDKLPAPLHVFFLGRGAPHVKNKREQLYHQMDEEQFKKEVFNLGGTPVEFFDYPELMEYLLPILKNDFKISETAAVTEEIKPLDCNITVFMGKEEKDIEAEHVHGWRLHTVGRCVVHYFNGGHFFVNDCLEEVTKIIGNTLNQALLPK